MTPDQIVPGLRGSLAELGVVSVTPAEGGESGQAFWVTDDRGTVRLLKLAAGTAGYLRELDAVVERLRTRGYPAARIHAIGEVAGQAFWIQERLPGSVLRDEATGRFLPRLLGLNDAQAGLGSGASGWRELIAATLATGGNGYCVHATLAADPRTRGLLDLVRRIGDRCAARIPDGEDFVHYDFTPANLLSDGMSITGVIDVSPPVLNGDRAFDLATLLFYRYDDADVRERLRARLAGIADGSAVAAYLAHLVLRQVDWSLRYHPDAAATRRHLRLAGMVAQTLRAL